MRHSAACKTLWHIYTLSTGWRKKVSYFDVAENFNSYCTWTNFIVSRKDELNRAILTEACFKRRISHVSNSTA